MPFVRGKDVKILRRDEDVVEMQSVMYSMYGHWKVSSLEGIKSLCSVTSHLHLVLHPRNPAAAISTHFQL